MLSPINLTFWQTNTHLETMLEERLELYEERMGRLPNKIVVFRIGCTKDLLQQVLANEMPLMEASIASREGYKPKITIILCQQGERNLKGAQEFEEVANAIQDVPLIHGHDFYGNSRASQGQGPSNYAIILDESDLFVGDLQDAIRTLSYLWERSSRNSTLVAPARCALQATRHASAFIYRLNSAKTAAEKDAAGERLVKESERGFVHENLRDTTYYM